VRSLAKNQRPGAVMALGGVMLAGGIISLIFVNDVRGHGSPVSVFGAWARVLAGHVILIWPQLALRHAVLAGRRRTRCAIF
jgi:hypothetical protein